MFWKFQWSTGAPYCVSYHADSQNSLVYLGRGSFSERKEQAIVLRARPAREGDGDESVAKVSSESQQAESLRDSDGKLFLSSGKFQPTPRLRLANTQMFPDCQLQNPPGESDATGPVLWPGGWPEQQLGLSQWSRENFPRSP